MEVHINPVLPPPVLLVAGSSPIALALVRLGRAMGYTTVAATPEDEALADAADEVLDDLAGAAGRYAGRSGGARLCGLVATMGRSDERALVELAAAKPDYLGVIASPTRMEEVRRVLAAEGLGEEEIARVRGPAGLDIGAESPEEIAVSILAEIVELAAGQRDSGSSRRFHRRFHRRRCCPAVRRASHRPGVRDDRLRGRGAPSSVVRG